MKTKLIVTIISTIVIALGGTVAGVAITNNPSYVASRSIQNFAENFLERAEFKDVQKVLKGGSMQLSLTGVEDDGEELLKNKRVEGKVYFSNNALMLSDVDVKLDGLDISGDIYVSEEKAYFNDYVMGAYGIDFSTAKNELENSIFAPDANTDYSLDEDLYEQVVSVLDGVNSSKVIKKDLEKLTKTVFKDVWSILMENCEITSKNASVRLNEEKKDVRLITITVDNRAMENIIYDVYDYLCESKEIKKFLDKHENDIVAILPSFIQNEIEEYDSLSEMYEDMLYDLEDFIDDYWDDVDENFQILTVDIATPKTSTNLLKLEYKYNRDTYFMLDCGSKGVKKTDLIKVEIAGTEIEYNLKSNDNKEFNLAITVDEGPNHSYEASINFNKKRGYYDIDLKECYVGSGYYDESYTHKYKVQGTFETKQDTTTLTVDSFKSSYYEDDVLESANTINFDCEIIIDTKDKMPKPIKDYTTVSLITEKEFENLIKRITS